MESGGPETQSTTDTKAHLEDAEQSLTADTNQVPEARANPVLEFFKGVALCSLSIFLSVSALLLMKNSLTIEGLVPTKIERNFLRIFSCLIPATPILFFVVATIIERRKALLCSKRSMFLSGSAFLLMMFLLLLLAEIFPSLYNEAEAGNFSAIILNRLLYATPILFFFGATIKERSIALCSLSIFLSGSAFLLMIFLLLLLAEIFPSPNSAEAGTFFAIILIRLLYATPILFFVGATIKIGRQFNMTFTRWIGYYFTVILFVLSLCAAAILGTGAGMAS